MKWYKYSLKIMWNSGNKPSWRTVLSTWASELFSLINESVEVQWVNSIIMSSIIFMTAVFYQGCIFSTIWHIKFPNVPLSFKLGFTGTWSQEICVCFSIPQGSHRLEKYLNIQDCLEKSLKIKFALKSTWKRLKDLEKSWNFSICKRIQHFFGGLN